jgi:hypothetical protein
MLWNNISRRQDSQFSVTTANGSAVLEITVQGNRGV